VRARRARPTRSSSATSTIRTAASPRLQGEVRNYRAARRAQTTRARGPTYLAAVRKRENPEASRCVGADPPCPAFATLRRRLAKGAKSATAAARADTSVGPYELRYDGQPCSPSTIRTRRLSAPAGRPVIAAGPHLRHRHRQDQRDRPDGAGRRSAGTSASAPALLFTGLLLVSLHLPGDERHRHLGQQTSRSAGAFDITNFVWWIGIGHAGTPDLGDPAAG